MEPIPLVVAAAPPRWATPSAGRRRTTCTAGATRSPRACPRASAGTGPCATCRPYRAAAERHIPAVVAELDGAAAGADLARDDLFLLACDEAWNALGAGDATLRGCTDIAAAPAATADGSLLVGHTNDLGPSFADRLVAIDRQVDGEPRLFTIGIGPLISIGLNDAGLALGGNALEPNDERVGVPRWPLVRHLLAQRTAAGALAVALHPGRASAYNDVLAHRDGSLVNVEASATAADVHDAVAASGVTVHANHYARPGMERFEARPATCDGSRARHARAAALAEEARGRLDAPGLRRLLADHAEPHPICRHDAAYPTVFWCVIDVVAGAIDYGRGQPCLPGGERFAFAAAG